jgi:serine protease Do
MMYRNMLAGVTVLIALGAPLAAQPAPPTPPATPARLLTRGGFLGVGIQEITPDRAKALKLPETAGVEVTRVRPDSPAEMGGIKTGDVIVQFSGSKVEGIEQMSRMVREAPVGREVKVDIIRDGAPVNLTVKIGTNPGMQLFSRDNMIPNMPDVPRVFQGWHSPILGVEVEAIDGQLAQFFGVDAGVLVRSVMQHSPAERAAMRAGDVIVRVDDATVTTPAQVSAKLRSLSGKTFNVAVMREHKEVHVQVTLDPMPDSGRH